MTACGFAITSAARAQDSVTGFGTVSLGSSSTQTVTLTNLSSTPASFVLTYGVEFTKTNTPSCSGTPVSCSVQVQFAPAKAGWRQDGLLAENGSGTILGVASLYGIGQGPQAIFLPGTITTLAGTYVEGGSGGYGTNQINGPEGMAVDAQRKYVYFADSSNDVIRRMDAKTGVMTVYAGEFVNNGSGDGTGAYSGDGGPATSARLSTPYGVALDNAGNLYIADYQNNVIRKVDPTGIITTVAGEYSRGGTFYGDGGAATSAGLAGPISVAIDSQGNLYIADQGNQRIRKVTTDGNIHTFAGNGTSGYSGDGGAATSAELCYPGYVTVDSSGNVYITDYNNVVRKVTTDGVIHTVAGVYVSTGDPQFGGQGGYSGDGGQATSAEMNNPTQVAVDAAGNIYIDDNENNVIRRVNTSGVINTIVGNFADGYGYSGDGGAPTSAQLNFPTGLAVSADGTLFISDAGNNVIRGVSYSAPTFSFAPTNVGSESSSQGTTIENIGDTAMPFTGLTTGTNFVQTASGGTDCSASTDLAIDGSCEIAVAFEPEQGGSLTGRVTVTSGAFDIPLDGTGNGPAASPNPTTLSFGNQTVNTTSTAKTITLTNSGNQTLTISSISITGTNSGDFSQTNNCGSSISATGNCTISVTFTPSATGSRSATLSISDNANGSPQGVSLTGTGTGTPQISFSPSSWSFGNQVVSTSSTAESITVTNPGNATLTISSVSITGTNGGDFSQTNNCSTVAAGSGSCIIQVTFTPSATGSRSASVSVTDNASGSPHTVALSGTGTAPQISFSPSSWAFGNQVVNTTSTAESITVTNPGTATLTISAVSITGTNAGDFSQTNNCSTVAAGSGSCTIQVTFTPSAIGSRSASVSVTDNASGSPHTVSLSGTGTAPQISFSPSSWAFGNQVVNTTSTAESITVTNPGTSTLTISSVSITGTNAGDFSQANNCSTIAAGSGSCTIQVTFTPSATGSRRASISVMDNASGSPHTVSLTGAGIIAQIAFSPASWNFGNQLVGAPSAAESITVTNPGTAILAITNISVTGSNTADFSQTNNCGTVAAGSGSCSIQVVFTPAAAGVRSASLVIGDNVSGSPQSISISGTGVAPQVGLSTATMSFGNQLMGTGSGAQTLTISNTGTATLMIAGVAISGTNSAEFAQTNNCGTVLAGSNCTVSLNFTPSGAGTRAANVTISDNAAGSPQVVALSGTGMAAGSPTVFIDQPSSLSGAFEGLASFSGWAVDNYYAIVSVSVSVDGIPRGTATYGGARQDVCQSLPNAVGCPNVGWTFLLDTGLLSNGSHTVVVSIATSDGRTAASGAKFAVANWVATGNAMALDIDKPALNAPPVNGQTQVGGWAIDNTAPIASIVVSVDGVRQGTAAYGGVRADVCAVYTNRPGCPNVGWNYVLNTRLLTDGAHQLAITGRTADGQTSTIERAFSVSNIGGGGASTHISIGRPNSSIGALSGHTVLGGWALDDNSTIGEVDVSVDGTLLGAAQYGILRTDVCAVYAGRPGCPDVGWGYILDTTQLTDGPHTLEVTAKTAAGGATTVSTAFTVSNLSSVTRVFIDAPSGTDGAYEGLVSFAGWALDDTASIVKVTLTVDGGPYGTASYGSARPDVCAVFPNRPGCPAVGWSLLFDTGQIPNGTHVLGVTATTADGRSATASSSFTVANWLSGAQNDSMRLDVDAPNSQSGPLSGTAHMGGWAIDDRAAITSVQVTVDNVPMGTAVYGGARPDVCAAYPNRAGCPNVGWNFYLDTTVLADGPHTLALTGMSSSGQSSTITASFTVANQNSEGMRLDIDRPTVSSGPVGGLALVGGWAIDNSAAIARLEILVDGTSVGLATYGAVRTDVCAVYPGRRGCPNVGWNFLLDTTQFADGTHQLEVTGTSTNGQRATIGSSFSIQN